MEPRPRRSFDVGMASRAERRTLGATPGGGDAGLTPSHAVAAAATAGRATPPQPDSSGDAKATEGGAAASGAPAPAAGKGLVAADDSGPQRSAGDAHGAASRLAHAARTLTSPAVGKLRSAVSYASGAVDAYAVAPTQAAVQRALQPARERLHGIRREASQRWDGVATAAVRERDAFVQVRCSCVRKRVWT